MVTIRKQKAQNKWFSWTYIFVYMLLLQVLAVVFLFQSKPSKTTSEVQAESLQDRLKKSVVQRSRRMKKTEEAPENDTPDDSEEQPGEDEDSPDEGAEGENDGEESYGDNHGTHSTGIGYFNDYEYERENPPFRQASVAGWDDAEQRVSSSLQDKPSLRSCQYLSDNHQRLYHSSKCSSGTPLIAYNNQAFPRFWCGVEIPPHAAVKIEQTCPEPVRLFPIDPPLNGQGFWPIVLKDTQDPLTDPSKLETVECDIPCQRFPKLRGSNRYIDGTPWTILQTMDDPVKRPDEKVERHAYRLDQYYSTTSFDSSVPLTHFSFDQYDIFTTAVDYDKVEPTGSYLVDSQCVAQAVHRNRWQDAVHLQAPVASYGSCAHNTEVPNGMSLRKPEDRIALMRKHRFNLAFEFGDAKDHITPVVWEAFSSGTLPVVLGASNVNMHFPPNSYISNANCQRWDDLGKKVKDIVEDKKQWESYQSWRNNPEAKRVFEEKYNFTRTSPDCRMCRWAYAKRFGHGWNHKQQVVRPTKIDRTFCLDGSQMAAKPFVESWHFKSLDGNYEQMIRAQEGANCGVGATGAVSLGPVVTRTLHEHDHVFDFTINKLQPLQDKDMVVLRLEVPVLNTDGAHFQDAHTLVPTARGALASSVAFQDKLSKITALASWETEVRCTAEGVLEVVVQTRQDALHHGDDEVRRIRVIIEDMVELYDKVTEFWPTSFAQMMIQDFVDPLELYYVD